MTWRLYVEPYISIGNNSVILFMRCLSLHLVSGRSLVAIVLSPALPSVPIVKITGGYSIPSAPLAHSLCLHLSLLPFFLFTAFTQRRTMWRKSGNQLEMGELLIERYTNTHMLHVAHRMQSRVGLPGSTALQMYSR